MLIAQRVGHANGRNGVELAGLASAVAEPAVYSPDDASRFAEATQALRLGDLGTAKKLLHVLQSRFPRSPEIMNNLAVIEQLGGDRALAALMFQQASKSAPHYLRIYTNAQRQKREADASSSAPYWLIDQLPQGQSEPFNAVDSVPVPDNLVSFQDLLAVGPLQATSDVSDDVYTEAVPSAVQQGAVQVDSLDAVQRALLDALEKWRLSWQMQDIHGYLGWYADDFRPAMTAQSLATWKKQRQDVFSRSKQKTTIALEYLVVSIGSPLDHDSVEAVVGFDQLYHSSDYADRGRKTMRWRRERGQWRILSESFRNCPTKPAICQMGQLP
jgi:ketosteroid isomerase-like protein